MFQLKAKSPKLKAKYIIGIDEAGRGPLAGPIVVAALAMPRSLIRRELNSRIFANNNSRLIRDLPLRDSKRLNKDQREQWFKILKNHPDIFYATTSISPKTIDKINISQAANLASGLALEKLIKNNKLRIKNYRIYLDGGLYIDNSKLKIQKSKLQLKNQNFIKTIINGDETIPAIMLASIIAKVTRDRIMRRLHKKYPEYGFDGHKGYGTKKHREAIKKNGHSPVHRRSFKFKK